MIPKELIEKYCLQDNLKTYDPYDIWKTKLGFLVKNGFNKHRTLFIIPAAIFTIFDIFINNKIRLFYKKQEYPIVRAFAALSLINLYKKYEKQEYIEYTKKHIDWLLKNYSNNLKGYGWGINFKYPVKKNVFYDENAALTTITPYVLEAFNAFYEITGDGTYQYVLKKIFDFFMLDVKTIEENETYKITSYGTFKDRAVVNAVSYTMYSLSLLFKNIPSEKQKLTNETIRKLYNFVVKSQQKNGSWFYDYYDKSSFIDCFHSAFVLKNLIKTTQHIDLPNINNVIKKGFSYIHTHFYDKKKGLYKRFSVNNKPSIIKYDLYDNAEMLNLLLLLNEYEQAKQLQINIDKNFIKGNNIFSTMVLFNLKINKNTLRWAVMPYLYSLSILIKYNNE